jgi:hypothetical protein
VRADSHHMLAVAGLLVCLIGSPVNNTALIIQ